MKLLTQHFLVHRLTKTIILALIIAPLQLGTAIRELPSGIKTKMPLLFHELSNEGHLKASDKVLVITRNNNRKIYDSRNFGNKNEIKFISNTDLKRQNSLPNEYFDFVFTNDLSNDKKLIDRTLKVHGIVTYVYTIEHNLAKIYPTPDYKVVYLRKFDSTAIVTLQKTNEITKSPTKRRLLRVATPEDKNEILEKLEDVLLEPPRAARSKKHLKKTKYLPELLGDSLESYPRRIFIDVGPQEKVPRSDQELGWFAKHYPRKNKDFDIYRIDTVGEDGDDMAQVGMSEWLRKNVKEEEYVVMKADAEVAEEMARNGVLDLVDELFLECKYQGLKGNNKKNRRAYWECLALYGRLRDEGVAVHQWWG